MMEKQKHGEIRELSCDHRARERQSGPHPGRLDPAPVIHPGYVLTLTYRSLAELSPPRAEFVSISPWAARLGERRVGRGS